jgi:hypothetical protein
MVIVDVFANQPTKMSLMECNDMIENLAPATSHPSFRGSILPWRMNARPFGLQSRCLEESDHRAIECRVAIEDHVPIRTSFGESFAQLLDNPIRCGVAGHVEVQNPAPPNSTFWSRTPASQKRAPWTSTARPISTGCLRPTSRARFFWSRSYCQR